MVEQVDFYILGEAEHVAKLRYACRIALKAYTQGLKVYLQTASPEQSEQLDGLLWTFSQGSFMPHKIANNGAENWQHFPVQLGDTLNDNASDDNDLADLLICLTNDVTQAHAKFKRIADLTTSDPAEKTAGRNRFRYYREQGVEPKTHLIE